MDVYGWVLILMFKVDAISQHTYRSKDSCLNARHAVVERFPHGSLIAVCVPVSVEVAREERKRGE